MRQRAERGFPVLHYADNPEVIERDVSEDKTGRKVVISRRQRERVIHIARTNPRMSVPDIAKRMPGVSARQVQYICQNEGLNREVVKRHPMTEAVLEMRRLDPSIPRPEIAKLLGVPKKAVDSALNNRHRRRKAPVTNGFGS